jgi:cytochrome c oxidase subunit II
MIPTLAQIGKDLWMPDQASTYGPEVDFLFYFIYWVSVGAFVLIMALMILFMLRYRHRPGHKAQHSHAHSTALELTWTIIPTFFLILMFYWGFRGFLDMATPPDYAYEIQVTGIKWGWTFQYPNGASSPDLHVPIDKPVRLILSSQDVIHSLFIPAFRCKKDVVPGRYNSLWFHVTAMPPVREGGESYFDLYCTEYCGTNHSTMRAKVFVHESAAFVKWLDEAANWVVKEKPVVAGKKLYAQKGCTQCHSDDGKTVIGPTFKNIFGYEHAFKDGTKAIVDENYIRESILNPGAKIVAGYDNVMPSYQGRMKDVEITAIIEWLKSISDKGPKPLEAFPVAPDKAKAAAAAASGSPAPTTDSTSAAVGGSSDSVPSSTPATTGGSH